MNRLKTTFAILSALLLSIAGAASDAVMIKSVGVSHTPDGIQIEIAGSGALQQKTLHLSGPERLVIDVPNSIPMNQHTIAVNAPEARDVRVAQFQAAPPVTRVVVDLGANVKYDISSQGNRVLVNLHSGPSASASAKPQSVPAAKPAPVQANAAAPNAAPKPAPQAIAPKVVAASQKNTAATSLKPASFSTATRAAAHKPAPEKASPKASADKEAKDAKDAQDKDTKNAPVQMAANSAAKSGEMGSADAESREAAGTPAGNSSPDSSKDAPKDASKDAAKDAAKDFVVADTKPAQPTSDAPAAPSASAPTPKQASPDSKPAQPAPAAPSTATAATSATTATNLAREQQQQNMQAQHAAPRAKYTGAPYSFNLKDADLKDFFRAIAEITGLNIVLDPNVKGSLTLDLHDVPWDQALDIVLENNNLDKQLEGNVLRIATMDTLRQEAEGQLAKARAQALAVNVTTYTHYLSYAHSKDVITTLKKFLSQRGDISADERTNAVIVRDIPSTIPEIQRLLIQLDRKTQQVEIEARVVAATRNFAREIGTQLGFGLGGSIGSTMAAVGGTGAVGQTPTTVGYAAAPPYVLSSPATGSGVTQSAIPLFSNLGLTSPTSGIGATLLGSNWRLDSVLTLAESRGLLKVLSRPHVVTQNNVKAIVKQGLRVPVVTQAQLGGPPTVTYVDAFLKLTVTPQITAEGTVFLDLEVENTTADFSREVQGNPTLVTQAEQTQVLVTNGGTVQIGGVMLTSNTVNVFQVPLLGDIPILGNAFKHRQVSTSTQELIFFITPKIIES
jgi:type IV pilus secretin PilQ/predicted competence protein